MKKLILLTLLVISNFCFSQDNQDYEEYLKLEEKAKILEKNCTNIYSNFEQGFYCPNYFPEWANYLNKMGGASRVYFKTVEETKSNIVLLENLKREYLKPNGAVAKLNSDYSKLKKVSEDIKKLEVEIFKYPYRTVPAICYRSLPEPCRDAIEDIEKVIQQLKSQLEYLLNKENSKTSQSNNESISNTNNSSSQQTDNTNNIDTVNTQDNSISESDRRTNDILERNGLNKTDAQRTQEITNIISDGIDDISDFIINSGYFSEENIAYRKKQREARKKRRKEKIEKWYLEEYYVEKILEYVYLEKDNMYNKDNFQAKSNKNGGGFGMMSSIGKEGVNIFYGFKDGRKWIVKPKYDKAFNFYQNRAVVKEKGDWKIIDIEGNEYEIPSDFKIINNSEFVKWTETNKLGSNWY